MTQFVDVANMARWLQQQGVENIIGQLMGYIKDDMVRWPQFEKTARLASHTPFGVIELMPTSDHALYSFKYVNGHPSNPARGFQTVVAFGLLADVDNGYPLFLAEMTLLTALRTAATSALVAKELAREDSSRMAMIGCGSQAEFQALGMRAALGIEELTVFDTDPAAVDKFIRNLEPLGFKITRAADVDQAVAGADIITTCTADKAHNTILHSHQVKPGVHLNAVGGDCPGKTELAAEILDRAKVFVEYPPQTRIEGEIQQKDADFPVTELWQVLAGQESGRSSREEITLFDSVGFAIADFSALRYCYEATSGTDLQQPIDLIADPDDPKDLFSLTKVKSPLY